MLIYRKITKVLITVKINDSNIVYLLNIKYGVLEKKKMIHKFNKQSRGYYFHRRCNIPVPPQKKRLMQFAIEIYKHIVKESVTGDTDVALFCMSIR